MKKSILIILLIFSIVFFSCCANDKFHTTFEHYKTVYFEATDFIPSDMHGTEIDILSHADLSVLQKNLSIMQDDNVILQSSTNTRNEEFLAKCAEADCMNIEFLIYAYQNIDTLSAKDKMKLSAIYDIILTNRDGYSKN